MKPSTGDFPSIIPSCCSIVQVINSFNCIPFQNSAYSSYLSRLANKQTMRKYNLLIVFSLLVFVAINVMFFRNFYKIQVAQHKNLLFKQSEVCTSEIERVVLKFESDLNYILFSDDIAKLFADNDTDGLGKLQLFYSTYNNLIKNIDIYDNNKNVLNLFRDRKQNFITDRYIAQRQRKLAGKDNVITKDSDYQYVLPVFKDNELFANVLVTINLNDYILSELEKFPSQRQSH